MDLSRSGDMAVGKKGDVFFQKCSAFTPSNFYDRSSICRSFGVPVPPSRKQVEGCGQGTPRKRRGAGLGMGDDGRDGDEASHGTLSLSPPGTRVIGSDRRSGCCGDRKGVEDARKVYVGQAGQIADVAVRACPRPQAHEVFHRRPPRSEKRRGEIAAYV